MSYRDKQCKGCVGIKHECVMPTSLEYKEVTFICSCIDCIIKVLCRKDCVLYNQYLSIAKIYFNKGGQDRLDFIDTAVFSDGSGGYRNFLSRFAYPWKDYDEEENNMVP